MKSRAKFSLAAVLLTGIAGVVYWVVAGLPSSFIPDDQPVGYVGQPGVSSHILYTGADTASRTRLYALDYDATDWSGNLYSYPLTAGGAVVRTDDWQPGGAAGKIDAQAELGTRKIITRDGTTNIQFRWSTGAGVTSTLSAGQKSVLDSANAGNASSPVLDFIRGDRSNEKPDGLNYRKRSTVLGDIIHSTPVYCDASDCTAATVFVGANDGMLHAIDAASGDERFAYVPSMLMPKLSSLTSDPYTHRYYVDGRMDIRKFGSQTILAGALGAGGKGLFALDVTDAAPVSEAAATGKILWEITDSSTGFANLGYTYGQPVLATLVANTPVGGQPSAGGAVPTPVLFVPNGYGSASGRASLFLINATNGVLIQEISVGTDGSSSDRNGLSSPTVVDTNGDGKVDSAYAGDLFGNLFKIKLESPYTVTKLFTTTTSPVQPITMAPGIVDHPEGGFMVTFATGRMLLQADTTNTDTYYAYGIWDGAPVSNTSLLTQTLTETTYTGASPSIRVRTATANEPNWAPGGHRGWSTALPMSGERVVGDGAYNAGAVFVFMTTNPTVTATPPAPDGENWWMQLNALTGGATGAIRFDLNASGTFTSDDQVSVGDTATSPVGRNMGGGRRSQLTAISGGTFVVYQANYDKNAVADVQGDLGVSGGHFDYDIYYPAPDVVTYEAGASKSTGKSPYCEVKGDVTNEKGGLSPTYCNTARGYPSGYEFMSKAEDGKDCGGKGSGTVLMTITCNTYTTKTNPGKGYKNWKHVHEYDDIYDVTGVNMLHPSEALFRVTNAITSPSTEFKILVMNQFLNPAAKLAVGTTANVAEESVKTYGGLAGPSDDAAAVLAGLQTYTTATLQSFVFNLPKTAFQSLDWWGSGGDGALRAGLIPTQTGCVNKVSAGGVAETLGPNGERYNGALTIQIIRADTLESALELNRAGDVRYGWRVNAANFMSNVLAEYTTFWHHPNGKCYGEAGWVQNPPQDAASDAKTKTGAPDAADPKGVFGGPGGTDPTIVSQVNNNGTTTTTYSNGTVVINYPDGSSSTTTSDGEVSWNIPGVETGGVVDTTGAIDTGVEAPGEPLGRIGWRELRR